MTKHTYSVVGIGSYGPAHPLHNPAVRVYLREDGELVRTVRQPDARSGHIFAIEAGYSWENEERANSDQYQSLLAEIRHK